MKLEELGKNISNARRTLGKTQEDIAFELDISITAYAKIERGETNVGFLRLAQIAELLKVPISKLVEKENSNNDFYEILSEIKTVKEEIVSLKNLISK